MQELRVGIVGAGAIGADHARRITERTSGAKVVAVVDPNEERAREVAAIAGGADVLTAIDALIATDRVDAVMICSPGRFHEAALLPALEARLPIFCEKPLTPDSASGERVLEAEQRLDRPHIQVGFMRRFDAEYMRLRELVASADAGELLMIHAAHRNARPTNPEYVQQNLIDDSVVHEFDVLSWVAGSPVRSVTVRQGRRNSLSLPHLHEPILVLMELDNGVLVDVEMNVSAQFGYQVTTEAVFEKGVARIGQPSGLELWQEGAFRKAEHTYYDTRFAQAFDTEVQRWVNAVRDGRLVDGPNAWDGFQVALACEAGVEALRSGRTVDVRPAAMPEFYAPRVSPAPSTLS